MKIRITIFFCILFNLLQVNAMEKIAQLERENSSCFEKLQKELCLRIIYLSAKDLPIVEICKRTAALRLVNKNFCHLNSDIELMSNLFSSHLYDKDYTQNLNKILSRASRFGNICIILALNQTPAIDKQRFSDAKKRDSDSDSFDEDKTFLGAHINTVDIYGYIPLLHATEGGHVDLIKLLLKNGALINFQNKDKDTALIIATRRGHQEVIENLLADEAIEKGINLKGFAGETAFLCAAKRCLYASDEIKENLYLTILELLAAHGADVNAFDAADLSAMDWAAKEGKVKLIGKLLDFKVSLSNQNKARLDVYLFGVPANEEIKKMPEKIKAFEETSIKIDQVEFQLKNKPYWLSFEIGGEIFKIKIEDEYINNDFVNKVKILQDDVCIKIGEAIVEKVYIAGALPDSIVKNCSDDSNDYRLAFMLIFGEIFAEPYYLSEKMENFISMKKIRRIVMPIFKAYPEKNTSIYSYGLKDYNLVD